MANLYVNGTTVVYDNNSPGQGFTDESANIVAWDLYGASIGMNFYQLRAKINTVFLAECPAPFSGFSQLTAGKKEVAARYFLVPKALRYTVVDATTDQSNWINALAISKPARVLTIDKIRSLLSEELRLETMTQANIDDLFEDIALLKEYFIHTNNQKLKRFVNSESEYLLTGFSSKSYYTAQRKTDILSILAGTDF